MYLRRFPSFFLILMSSVILSRTEEVVAQQADQSYTVDFPATVLNGKVGHVLDGGDRLSILPAGSISVAAGRAVLGNGEGNLVSNAGNIAGEVAFVGGANLLDNSGRIESVGPGKRHAVDMSLSPESILKNTGSILAESKAGGQGGEAHAVHLEAASNFRNEQGASITALSSGQQPAAAVGIKIAAGQAFIPQSGGIFTYLNSIFSKDSPTSFLSSGQGPTVWNAGSINAEIKGKGGAIGIVDSTGSDITNTGSIRASSTHADSFVAGISLSGSKSAARVTNEAGGSIVAVNEASDSDSLVFGIQQTQNSADAEIINKGKIEVSSAHGSIQALSIVARRTKVLLAEGSTLKATGSLAQAVFFPAAGGVFRMEKGAKASVESEGGSAFIFAGDGASVTVDGDVDMTKVASGSSPESQDAVVMVSARGASLSVGESGSIRGVVKGDSNLAGINLDSQATGAKISFAGKLQVEGKTGASVSGVKLDGRDNSLSIEPSGRLDVVADLPGSSPAVVRAGGANAFIENKGHIGLRLLDPGAIKPRIASGSSAVVLNAPKGRLINSGEIVSDFMGVSVLDDARIRNKGTIKSDGQSSCAICLKDSRKRLTLVNSGKIEGSESAKTAAIDLLGAADLRFRPGTQLKGDVVLHANDNKIYIDGRGGPSRWVFKGEGSIQGGQPKVRITKDQAVFYENGGREVLIIGGKPLSASELAESDALPDDFDDYKFFESSESSVFSESSVSSESSESSESSAASESSVSSKSSRSSRFPGNSKSSSEGYDLSILGAFQDSSLLLKTRRFGLLDSPSASRGLWASGLWSQDSQITSPSGKSPTAELVTVGFDGAVDPEARMIIGGMISFGKDRNYSSDERQGGIDSALVLGGRILGRFSRGVFLDLELLMGIASQRSAQKIQGSTQALSASRENQWVSPGFTLGVDLGFGGWTFRPSAYASITNAMIPGYKEENSVLSIDYSAQYLGFLVARTELEVVRKSGKVNLGVYGGYQYMHTWTSDVSVRVRDQEKTIVPLSLPNRQGFYGGTNISVSLQDNVSVMAGGRVLYDESGSLSNVEANVILAVSF